MPAVPSRHGVREAPHSAGQDGPDVKSGAGTHVPDCLSADFNRPLIRWLTRVRVPRRVVYYQWGRSTVKKGRTAVSCAVAFGLVLDTIGLRGAMTLQELRDRRREEIMRVAAHRGARNVRVFGSVARGDNDEKSDVDFLVEMEPGRTLF